MADSDNLRPYVPARYPQIPGGESTYITQELDKIARAVRLLVEAQETSLGLQSYVKTALPSATTAGRLINVSNEAGGAVPAFSDGTNWRRVTDRAVVS